MASFDGAVALKRKQIIQRATSLAQQLSPEANQPLAFNNGVARLSVWTAWDDRRDAFLEESTDPDGKRTLSINSKAVVSASRRARVILGSGHYRFQGSARTTGVVIIEGKSSDGAGLRVSGDSTATSKRVTGDHGWQPLECEFEVVSPATEVELLCELRANQGSAWFDLESLQLAREDQ